MKMSSRSSPDSLEHAPVLLVPHLDPLLPLLPGQMVLLLDPARERPASNQQQMRHLLSDFRVHWNKSHPHHHRQVQLQAKQPWLPYIYSIYIKKILRNSTQIHIQRFSPVSGQLHAEWLTRPSIAVENRQQQQYNGSSTFFIEPSSSIQKEIALSLPHRCGSRRSEVR